jgi:3-oxoacyl-[acyl-carrier-protein] synthase II
LLALRDGFLPANINFRAPDAELGLDIIANEPRDIAPSVALSNSFGFGGTNATVVLERSAAR